MCIVQKKIAENLLMAVQKYFRENTKDKSYQLDVCISDETAKYLEDNGYKREQQENGRTKIIKQ